MNKISSNPHVGNNIDIEELLLKIYAKEISLQNGRKWTAMDLRFLSQQAQQKVNEKKADTLRHPIFGLGTCFQLASTAGEIASSAYTATNVARGLACKAASKLANTGHEHLKGKLASEGAQHDHKYQTYSHSVSENTDQIRDSSKSSEAMFDLLAKFIRRDEQFNQSNASS